jgi:hypothetical protein
MPPFADRTGGKKNRTGCAWENVSGFPGFVNPLVSQGEVGEGTDADGGEGGKDGWEMKVSD